MWMGKEEQLGVHKGKRMKTKRDLKWRVLCGDMSHLVIAMLQNMQLIVSLFVLLMVDVKSIAKVPLTSSVYPSV
jgi:hypothetical protein